MHHSHQGSSLGSCPNFLSPNPHFNRPSGHWLCVRPSLVRGSDKYRLETRNASSWDWNPTVVKSQSFRPSQRKRRNFTYIFIYIYTYRQTECSIYTHIYIYRHVLMTFELWTLCVRLCNFSLYISHLLQSSQQTSIAMWTILISKSWWWLLKPKR